MKKKASKEITADTMPTDITELAPLVTEFLEKLNVIKHEQECLKDQEKELFEEYESKIDMKEMKAALRVASIKKKISHKDAFDSILQCIEDEI
jgi:hypothetical protein